MDNKKMSINKPIVSITELCQMIQLSRARFYQLLDSGFFPKPLYDERSNRPYYDVVLQQKILEARQTGIGVDGSFMLFYSPRKNGTKKSSRNKSKLSPKIAEMTETLNSMGLSCSVAEVQMTVEELYSDGIDNLDHGVVIRDLFRHLKSK